jgi:hypothetical protein
LSEIDSLIEQIRCELRENPFFSEGDLAALDECLPTSDQIEAAQTDKITDLVTEDPCAKKTIDAVTAELEKNDAKLKAAVRSKYVISRLQELKDLLFPVEYFYKTREEFFTKIIKDLDQRFFTPGQDVNSQFTTILNKYELDSYKFNAAATATALSAIDQLNKDIKKQVEEYFSKKAIAFGQVDPITYSYNSTNPTFAISLPGKDGFTIKLSENQKTGKVDSMGNAETKQVEVDAKILPEAAIYETKTKVFQKRTLDLVKFSSQKYNDKAATDTLYPFTGHLAEFYKKIEDPLTLFTLQEKGLTTSSLKVDKKLTAEKLDGVVKEKRSNGNEDQFYIENTETYQAFYENLEPKIEARIELERKKFRENLISTSKLIKLSNLAKKQVFDLVNNSELKTKPTEKLIINGNTIEPTAYAGQIREKIKVSSAEISSLIKDINDRIAKIKKDNSPDPEALTKALSATGCVPPDQGPCGTLPKPGADALGYKSMIVPPTAANPDYTCGCYWKEVTKHLNKINLLPIPDIMRLPAFRYWPIGLLIPTPVPIRIPLPQIWFHIVTLNLPFGTLVIWYVQCGIVPSPIVMFIGPDGKKIVLLSFRALQGQFDPVGYTIDESSVAPLGINQTSIGKPSGTAAKTITFGNIMANAKVQKAAKIAAQAQALLELADPGKLMPNGFNIPFKPGENPKWKTGDEDFLDTAASTLTDFKVFVQNISRTICVKIDELGDFELPNFSIALRSAQEAEANRQAVLSGVPYTFDEAWLNCDPANLYSNIPADFSNVNTDLSSKACKEMVLSLSLDLDKFLDKLKLGTYTIPKEKGKSIKPEAMLDGLIDSVMEYMSRTNFGKAKSINFNKKFRKAMRDLDLNADIDKLASKVDITKVESVKAFKKTAKGYVDQICDVFSGKNVKVNRKSPEFQRKVDAELAKRKRFNEKNAEYDAAHPKQAARVQKYEKSIGKETPRSLSIDRLTVENYVYDAEVRKRKRFAEILGQSIAGFTKPIKDALGNFTQIVKPKCCPSDLNIPQFIDPLVLAIIMSFRQLAHAAIDALTTDLIKSIFGEVFSVTKEIIQSITNLIAKNIPNIDIPLNGAAALQLLLSILKPFLPLLRIPLGPLPRTLGVPQLSLNLDALIKPLLKAGIQILMDKILSFLPIRVCDLPITAISSAWITALFRGIKSALKKAIVELIEVILDPLQSLFKLINLLKGVKGAFTSLFDMTNPFLKIYKMIKEALERSLPTPAFIKTVNQLILLAQLEILKAMDKVTKNLPDIAVYLPIAAGQSLGLGNILRAGVHPILNQDDLPTWDRLTMKNPLYVMFLDDLAHKAKAATGTILGQDFLGTPVYVPTP